MKGFILPYAARQLNAVASISGLVGVHFDISVDHGYQLDEDLCGIIDNLLVGDKFPSLRMVALHKTIAPELFPELKKTGRLFTLASTFWTAAPVEEDINNEAPTKEDENRIGVEESTRRSVKMRRKDGTLESPTTNDTSYPQ